MAENKKILLKSSAGDNLYPRVSIDNLVDVVGGTTAVHVPTLDRDGRIDSRYLPPDFFPPAARVALSGTIYVSSGALLRDAEEASGFIRVLSGGSAKRSAFPISTGAGCGTTRSPPNSWRSSAHGTGPGSMSPKL